MAARASPEHAQVVVVGVVLHQHEELINLGQSVRPSGWSGNGRSPAFPGLSAASDDNSTPPSAPRAHPCMKAKDNQQDRNSDSGCGTRHSTLSCRFVRGLNSRAAVLWPGVAG